MKTPAKTSNSKKPALNKVVKKVQAMDKKQDAKAMAMDKKQDMSNIKKAMKY